MHTQLDANASLVGSAAAAGRGVTSVAWQALESVNARMRESENSLNEAATQNLAKVSKRFKTDEKKIADLEAKTGTIQQVALRVVIPRVCVPPVARLRCMLNVVSTARPRLAQSSFVLCYPTRRERAFLRAGGRARAQW